MYTLIDAGPPRVVHKNLRFSGAAAAKTLGRPAKKISRDRPAAGTIKVGGNGATPFGA